ncbi:hypothetical protein RB594_004006 [Gaeumannomyces avenae]
MPGFLRTVPEGRQGLPPQRAADGAAAGAVVQPLRVAELAAGRRWRAFLILTASMAHVPATVTPVATFAVAPGGLPMADIFTALSYLVLLSGPPRRLCQALPSLYGPVASGKSTLCKALLGEVPIARGDVAVTPAVGSVGFCDQNPFLLNATLRENVIGHSSFDAPRYAEVLEAAGLDADLGLLPDGDGTKVGSNGALLSGGQRHRVSLARAFYLDTGPVVVDDILGSLDANTGEAVFQRVFGRDGILRARGTTAVLCTNSARHHASADHVIFLAADGSLAPEGSSEQARESFSRRPGSWETYRHYFGQIGGTSAAAFVTSGFLMGAAANFSTVWVKYWSEDAFGRTRAFYVGIYALVRLVELGSLAACCVAVLIAAVSRTDPGLVVNLFSQDMTVLDGELPMALVNTCLSGFEAAGMTVVISLATPYLAVALYAVQKFYLRTSRQLRLLELESNAPVHSHLLETAAGLATIRASGSLAHFVSRNNYLLNEAQRPAYLLAMVQQWLALVLRLIVAVIATVAAGSPSS